jgi:cytochrome P450
MTTTLPMVDATSDRDLADRFDILHLAPSFYEDPYPTYRALQTHAPIKRLPNGSVFLTRYADLVAVYKDTQRFSSDKREEFRPKYGDSALFEHHTTSLVFNDPPLHTRVRKLIAGALTPKHIAAMEPALIARVDGLLDALAARATRGETVDLIEDFASAIPIEIIGNLLAIPHAERAPLRDWSLAILGALEPVLTVEQQTRGNAAVEQFLRYLLTLIADRTAHPGDPEIDVLSRLIAGEGEGAEHARLTASELMHNCVFLLNAGHETTTNLIGNGLVALTEWPDQRERLLADPSLINKAVEEFLRFESSNQLGNRITTETVEIGGVMLAARTPVHLCIGAANRDPEQFPDPDRLDIGRAPNRHLAFGSGPHQCVGLALARLEGRIALSHLLARFPHYRLQGRPQRGGRARFRGFLHVPACLI